MTIDGATGQLFARRVSTMGIRVVVVLPPLNRSGILDDDIQEGDSIDDVSASPSRSPPRLFASPPLGSPPSLPSVPPFAISPSLVVTHPSLPFPVDNPSLSPQLPEIIAPVSITHLR
jgi:hypothetical protein